LSDLRAKLPTYIAPNLAAKVERKVEGPLQLADLRKYFDDARNLSQESRTDSELSRDYYDSIQLTGPELAALRQRGQPPIIINRVQRAVDGIMGVVAQGKTDPRALMRNPPEEQPAPPPMGQQMPGQPPAPPPKPPLDAGDIASMALRFMADTSHFDALQLDVLENGLIEGCGAAIFEVDEQKNVTPTQIRWEEFFYDPYSRRPDFKDARYLGIAKWMYADALAALYPENKAALDSYTTTGVFGGGADDFTWGDRPESGGAWVDTAKKRVMVVECYHQTGGEWYRAVLYAGEILEYDKSPYLDPDGSTACPIEAWSAYVNRKNWRYGVVKPMRDIQDEINFRRSKALHEINTRQVQQTDPNAIPIAVETVRQEAAKPDGVIPPGWSVIPRNDVVANNLNLLQEAKGELDRMAPTPSVLGRGAQNASGRAQQVNQQAGLTELARVLGRHQDWKRRAYTQMWNRARQFWDGPKWIRVTAENDAPQYVQVNEPGSPVEQIDPATGQIVMVPGPPQNHIAKMDVDIVLEEVPDTATLEQEVFAELAKLAAVYGPQEVPFDIILEASSIPKKRELIEKFKAAKAAQAQAMAEAAKLKQAETQANIGKTVAETENKNADTKLKEIDGVTKAMDGAMQAQAGVMPPMAAPPQEQPPAGF